MSSYGNVPEHDVDAMKSAIASSHKVALQVSGVPAGWITMAYEAVLNGILMDWVENGTTGLSEQDEEDVLNLLRMSAELASAQPEHLRDTTFRILANCAMHDWVQNWNADEDGDDEED